MQMQIKRTNNQQYPPTGNDEDLFQRLSEYIMLFNREWIQKIKPASKASINLLMQVAQVDDWEERLPKSYQVFLEYMGANDGGLLSKSYMGTASVDEMIELYQDFHKFEPIFFNTSYFAFFSQTMGGELSFDLSEKHLQKVLKTDTDYCCKIVTDTFEKLLFQCAFFIFERHDNSIGFSVSPYNLEKFVSVNKKNAFEVADIVIEKYNLQKAWFSDAENIIALGIDCSFCMDTEHGASGFITGNDNFVEDVSELFAKYLGVNIGENFKK